MSFERTVEFVLSHEGLYSNDPDDLGGETVYGISRKYHPSWPGWILVDYLLKYSEDPDILSEHPTILTDAKNFYWVIWDKYCRDLPEPVALALFDSVFSCGPKATRWLQRGIKNQKLPIKIDGIMGPITSSKANQCQPWRLAIELLGFRIKFYIGKRISQKKYWNGWINRVCDLMVEVVIDP